MIDGDKKKMTSLNSNLLSVRSIQNSQSQNGLNQPLEGRDEALIGNLHEKELKFFIFFYLYKRESNDKSVYALDFMQNKKNIKTTPVMEFLSEVVSIQNTILLCAN